MKLDRLITPFAFVLVTGALVIMSTERNPDFGDVISFLVTFGTVVAIFSLISLGLNVQWGYTGIFNFGVMAFFLVGAFTAAIITKTPADGEFSQYVGGFGEDLDFIPLVASDQWLPFLVGIVGAAVFCGVLAFLLSIPALRLREDYLAITTIGIAELLRRITVEQRGLVNGTRGLPAIPRPLEGLVADDDYKFVIFGIAIVVLVVVFIVVERGIRSPWGRVLRAVREDELTTAASGKNVFSFKAQGFIVGAVIMGIGGAVFSYQRGAISPENFNHFFGTFLFWAMLIVGGSGNNKGAILGAYIVWGFWRITILLQTYDLPLFLETRIFFFRDFAIGLLIIGFLLLRPKGLLPEVPRVSIWVERRARLFRPPKPHDAESPEGPRPSG